MAVQAMISRTELHRIMDELYELGARAILATELAAGVRSGTPAAR